MEYTCEQYSTNINQIPDSFVAQAAAQAATGATPTIATTFATAGQSRIRSTARILPSRVIPSFWDNWIGPIRSTRGLSLAGYGCCGSSYNSLQATVTKRFQGGGTIVGRLHKRQTSQQH